MVLVMVETIIQASTFLPPFSDLLLRPSRKFPLFRRRSSGETVSLQLCSDILKEEAERRGGGGGGSGLGRGQGRVLFGGGVGREGVRGVARMRGEREGEEKGLQEGNGEEKKGIGKKRK